MPDSKPRISIVGAGWLGLPVGRRLVENGYAVWGSSTREEKMSEIQAVGMQPVIIRLPLESPNTEIKACLHSDIILITVPFKRYFPDPRLYLKWLKSLQAHIPQRTKIIFTSSTSIYPDDEQVWTEDMKIPEHSPRATVLGEAERLWMDHFDTVVCRLGGLIGPHRNLGDKLKKGQLNGRPECPLNLIYLEDCIRIIQQIIQTNLGNTIINCVADNPPTRRDYYTYVSKQLNLPEPQFNQHTNDTGKIVSNHKLHQLLPNILKYSDIKTAPIAY